MGTHCRITDIRRALAFGIDIAVLSNRPILVEVDITR